MFIRYEKLALRIANKALAAQKKEESGDEAYDLKNKYGDNTACNLISIDDPSGLETIFIVPWGNGGSSARAVLGQQAERISRA